MNNHKRWLLILLAFLSITLVVYAAGSKITLDSRKPMAGQIEAFQDWYGELDFLDQAQWDLAFNELTDPWNTGSKSEDQASFPDSFTEQMVYVLPKGEVYHLSNTCQYVKNKSNVRVMTLSDAKGAGYSRPCSKCGK